MKNDERVRVEKERQQKEKDTEGDEACPPGFVWLLFFLCHPSKPSATSVPLHTHSQTKACMHTHTVPNPRLAWCFWPVAQCLGCVSACVFMYFKAVLFRMQAGRESGFTADKSIWLISFCPRPLTRSACLCVCVCLTQAIEVRRAPGGQAGDGDWHQPSASSVTKSFLRDRKGSQ